MIKLTSAIILLITGQHSWSLIDPPKLPEPVTTTVQDAKESPAPVSALPAGWVVQFWSMQGCPPCEQWRSSQAGKLSPVVESFKLESSRDEARRLGVTRFPTLMLVDPDRKIRARWVGFTSAETIISRAEQLAAGTTQATYQRKSRTRWNVNGDWSPTREEVIRHIEQQHPRALSAVTPEHLRRMSLAELLALHDDSHNRAL